MNYEQIKELIELVSSKKLEALEIEKASFRLKIVTRSAPPAPQVLQLPGALGLPAASLSISPAVPSEIGETTAGESRAEVRSSPEPEHHILSSPIVGTFYVAPGPDSDPFVRVGDRVTQGQVVCIVEAMKLMNEIEADADGVITRAFPQNAQAVEFGEPLFAIDTDS